MPRCKPPYIQGQTGKNQLCLPWSTAPEQFGENLRCQSGPPSPHAILWKLSAQGGTFPSHFALMWLLQPPEREPGPAACPQPYYLRSRGQGVNGRIPFGKGGGGVPTAPARRRKPQGRIKQTPPFLRTSIQCHVSFWLGIGFESFVH